MTAVIQKAKNGENTALLENIFIHSNYNPSKEAERFVANLKIPYIPQNIVISEPGLSYIIPFFRNLYPMAKIGAIRYIPDFSNYNENFDFIINFYEFNSSSEFENYLFNFFGEEKLLLTYFCKWDATSKQLQSIDFSVWSCIKNSMEKAKTLLITRQYFEKKWLLNSVNFISNIEQTALPEKKIETPVIIISSGPSLIPFIEIIKQNQTKFFIICLSSAISVCIKNNIHPDLCLSTDGGYWAGQHLKKIDKTDTILALSSESYCPKKILNQSIVLPLDYEDGISTKLLKDSGLKCFSAKRNGTVSGTALELALSLSSSDIFFFGLDLANQKGFQHTQPNELDINSCISFNKINNSEKRYVVSEYSKSSLEIYLKWFQDFQPKERKIYRVINQNNKKNTLGKIKDIEIDFLKNYISKIKDSKENNYFKVETTQKKIYSLKAILPQFLADSELKKQLYPLDFIQYHHENNNEILKKIDDKHNDLQKKIWAMINE